MLNNTEQFFSDAKALGLEAKLSDNAGRRLGVEVSGPGGFGLIKKLFALQGLDVVTVYASNTLKSCIVTRGAHIGDDVVGFIDSAFIAGSDGKRFWHTYGRTVGTR